MILQPIMPWWLLVPVALLMLGATGWKLVTATRGERRGEQRLRWISRLAMVILVLLIAIRPSLYGGSAQTGTSSLDVFFAIDTTGSMVAEDYNGQKPRLKGVQSDIQALTTALAGARFTVITFDADATLALPLTADGTAVTSLVNGTVTESTLYSQGSSIDKPIDLLKKQLTSAKQAQPERKRILFYMGDGEQTNGKQPASFASLHPLLDGGAVLGYGTTSGGRMLEQDLSEFASTPTYIKDYRTKSFPVPDAISKIDEGNLQTIASQLGVQYAHRTQPDNAHSLIANVGLNRVRAHSRNVQDYHDIYWLFAFPLVGLTLWEAWRVANEISVLRQAKQAGGLS
jgi:Ca-activated chloride channel homolog